MKLYDCAQVRRMDEQAIACGISAYQLMQRAALAVLRCIQQQHPAADRLLIFCGGGNNGGDGYELACHAHRAGFAVQVIQLCEPDRLQGAARQAREACVAAGVECQFFQPEICNKFDEWLLSRPGSQTLVVDALLGTGARGAPREAVERAINWINQSALPVLAVDIPSGVNADTGHVPGVAVKAALTLSLIGRKQGLYTGHAPAFTGSIYFDDLGIPGAVLSAEPASSPSAWGIDASILMQLPPRPRTAHKGDAGRVLVVAGDDGFGGAALMASESAARSGAGSVSLITRQAHVSAMLARCPEIMVHALEQWQAGAAERADALLNTASSVVLGPGLGQSSWSAAVLDNVLARVVLRQIPMVLDADALNLLAANKADWRELAPADCRARWIITPHPGEAARLLGCSTNEIARDRFAAVRALQEMTGTVVILKGAGTLLAFPDRQRRPEICLEGNQAMACGGMGDVLAGICGALLAQTGITVEQAARLAVCAHGEAGDRAATALNADRGVLATDLFGWLPGLLSGAGDASGSQRRTGF